MISRIFNNEALAISQQGVMEFNLNVASGVCTATFNRVGFSPRILLEGTVGTAAKAILTQANIDLLLGSTNEVLSATAFGTTALVDDCTIGGVIDCSGQVSHIAYANLSGFCPTSLCLNSYGTAAGWNSDAAITDAAIAGLQVYVTSLGNIAFLANFTNLTAVGTSGSLVLRIAVKLK